MIPETISPSQQHQQSPSVLTEDILKTRRHNTLANALSSGDIQLKNRTFTLLFLSYMKFHYAIHHKSIC